LRQVDDVADGFAQEGSRQLHRLRLAAGVPFCGRDRAEPFGFVGMAHDGAQVGEDLVRAPEGCGVGRGQRGAGARADLRAPGEQRAQSRAHWLRELAGAECGDDHDDVVAGEG
jgi:hypothetical protein